MQNLNSNFIQLNRRFGKIPNDEKRSDEFDWHGYSTNKTLSWDDVLKQYRNVILSEAGSGKTREIREKAEELKNISKYSFFMRLEHVSINFEEAFEVGSFDEFKHWISSNEEAWLFLDSVDESRLRDPQDFEKALRKIKSKIENNFDRIHIILTARVSAWRPKTDFEICNRLIPYSNKIVSDTVITNHNSITIDKEEILDYFQVLKLEDLKSDQIDLFTTFNGIHNLKSFKDAIERKNAWFLTTRPLDLLELIQYWNKNGSIGNRLELIENSIEQRLIEHDQTRAEFQTLSKEKAFSAVKRLAAAAALLKNQDICVPDGAYNPKGISTKDILQELDSKEINALLARPIFDEALYGTVRFHHRSVREFLTAKWFYDLIQKNTSRRNIEALFFKEQYYVIVITPTLRPILPWLSILDHRIRDKVQEIAPEVFFEGGEPSLLSLDFRCDILQKTCKKIADGEVGYSINDYDVVQRFANKDMTDEISKLIKQYSNNNFILNFLLRMAWLGEMTELVTEALDFALDSHSEKYVRISAFRLVFALGSKKQKDAVLNSFIQEPIIDRDWLAELLDLIDPTRQNILWVGKCLEVTPDETPNIHDSVEYKLEKFILKLDLDFLSILNDKMGNLLCLAPYTEYSHPKLSKKHQWLLKPAAKALLRLVEAMHPSALINSSKVIASYLSSDMLYVNGNIAEEKTRFSQLIPLWKELNRTLFWHSVALQRVYLSDHNNGKLTHFWQVRNYGSFSQFIVDDFEYVISQIIDRELLDDKLIALSLAIELYNDAEKPTEWSQILKECTKDYEALTEALQNFLIPPLPNEYQLKYQEDKKRLEKRNNHIKTNKEKNEKDWRLKITNEFEEIRLKQQTNPEILQNTIVYLFDKIKEEKNDRRHYSNSEWECLIPHFGLEVAEFYRDSMINLWRHYTPKLESEGREPNTRFYFDEFGLCGLAMEVAKTPNWVQTLTLQEVELATRYAIFKLNGIPDWFSNLMQTYPYEITNLLLKEVRHVLTYKDSNIHISLMSKIAHSGKEIWNEIATKLIIELMQNEPNQLDMLDNMLKIIQGSSVSDSDIENLAKNKCKDINLSLSHLARWFAVWVGVSPKEAIEALKNKLAEIKKTNPDFKLAESFIAHLCDDRTTYNIQTRQAFNNAYDLKTLYLLIHDYIKVDEDIDRIGQGVYSPGELDAAQQARENLYSMLIKINGKEAYQAINEIAKNHPKHTWRPHILRKSIEKATEDADLESWTVEDLLQFEDSQTKTPNNQRELAELAHHLFIDIKDELENGDTSIANILRKGAEKETEMRNYLGGILRDKANGRYSIPQEEELADAKKPDLRFHGIGFDSPIPVELKLAGKWTGNALFERFENQLIGDYLRDNRSNFGLFILVNSGHKEAWELPNSKEKVNFDELILALQNYWEIIKNKYQKVEGIKVVGINLLKRSNNS